MAKRGWMCWVGNRGGTLAHAVNLETMRPYCGTVRRVPERAIKAPADADLCSTCVRMARGLHMRPPEDEVTT